MPINKNHADKEERMFKTDEKWNVNGAAVRGEDTEVKAQCQVSAV